MNPGIYDDLDEATYHADEALSASGAKKLLPPSCPAIFRWERDHGQPTKRAFDFGHAAHAKVLGVGAEIVAVQAADWRTKAAKEAAEEAREAGKTPLLEHEVAQVDGMAAAIKAHPIASALLNPDHGRPEVSLFWHDRAHEVDRRARLDWLPDTDGGRLIVADYKTTASADPASIRKTVANFAYHMQDTWYRDAVVAAGLADDVAFVFIFQQKTAPYLVTVAELDAEALRIGWALNDRALQVFRECSATGVWPGYADDVELISLPGWATYQHQELIP
jgi:hypothetical protein